MLENFGSKIIDLSVTVTAEPHNEPWPPSVSHTLHEESARKRANAFGLQPEDFPQKAHLASEEWTLITHVGTHMDAPWHYGPTTNGEPARKVEDVPLEWCIGNGVILDVTHRGAGEFVTNEDLEAAAGATGHEIRTGDIALVRTGADRFLGTRQYPDAHPGLTREAVFWLLDRGVKIIGTDAYGLDRPFSVMADAVKREGPAALFPAHYAGREREYCQIEKLCNLDKVPVSHGFTFLCLPIKLGECGGAWVRAVALLP